MFYLHPRLKEDAIEAGNFKLCILLLMNDANYPWFILVPRREGIREVYELSEEDQLQLTMESSYLSLRVAEIFAADKMNVAALGNIVPQLHIHHIVRYKDDPAWPDPVWGKVPARPYDEDEMEGLLLKLGDIVDNFKIEPISKK